MEGFTHPVNSCDLRNPTGQGIRALKISATLLVKLEQLVDVEFLVEIEV